MKSTTLYYREGSSDKVYRAELAPQDGGWVVRFAYGRRGSTMTTGTKTPEPVSLGEAIAIFDKLEAQKRAKGYTDGPDIEPYTGHNGATPTGILPQLLNPASASDVRLLLDNDAYLLQPKIDGRRCMLQKSGKRLIGINRRGLEITIPEKLRRSADELPGDWIIDGELVGETLHAFDLLEHDGNLRAMPFGQRLVALLNLLMSGQAPAIRYVAAVSGTDTKRRLFDQLRDDRAEGVVFKRIDAPYIPGRPFIGGSQLKHKFVETASVIILRANKRRSVAMGLFRGIDLLPAGNVTIPANHPVPKAGDIAEVRYLYAMLGSYALYQPVFLGLRDDIPPEDCTVDQLKLRPEPVEVAA